MSRKPVSKSSKTKKKSKSKNSSKISKLKIAKKTLKIMGTTLVSILLVIIITGSILSTALTIYVLKFMDNASLVTLDNLNLSYATILYAKDDNGNDVPIYTLSGGNKCIWVDIEKVPQHVQDAFVFAEDARFYSHEGVDFKRTFAAFSNFIFNFWGNRQGGSSITQQLVKNITNDDEQSPDRKIREIFSALNMERNYTKTDILEAYMNIAPFWYNMNGIQTAANFYFNKDVSELTPAEAASIVAITKSPKYNNPLEYPENNKKRQEYILKQMYKYGAISSEELEASLKEELHFVGFNKVEDANNNTNTNNVSSYFVDATIQQAQKIIKETYGLKDENEALNKLRSGGFRIYTTENINIQSTLEAKFKDQKTFTFRELKDPPQAATIIMDYKGNVKGVVGGIGEKKESLTFNRAIDAERSPGSCIKPLASYSPAIEMNKIHWSTQMIDQPLQVYNPKTGQKETFTWTNSAGETKPWPQNYEKTYTNAPNFTYYYLQHSKNTAAAYLIEDVVTPKTAYDFLKNNYHITTLLGSDIDRAPMALGALGHGLKLEELVAAYQAFGNLGSYYSPTFITKITDANGSTIYEHKYIEHKALSSDTAYVMNRLMSRVVQYGTGANAKNGLNCDLVGKTGTSMDNNDLLFVGCTPDYVAGIWYGYDTPKDTANTYYTSDKVWNNVYRDIVNTGNKKNFTADPNVEAKKFCLKTGLLAGPNCTEVDTGYYKKSYQPPMCPGDH